jgi:hypothetical protein
MKETVKRSDSYVLSSRPKSKMEFLKLVPSKRLEFLRKKAYLDYGENPFTDVEESSLISFLCYLLVDHVDFYLRERKPYDCKINYTNQGMRFVKANRIMLNSMKLHSDFHKPFDLLQVEVKESNEENYNQTVLKDELFNLSILPFNAACDYSHELKRESRFDHSQTFNRFGDWYFWYLCRFIENMSWVLFTQESQPK